MFQTHWALPEIVNEGAPNEYLMTGSHRLMHIAGGDCHVLGCCNCESCYYEELHKQQVETAEEIVLLLNLPEPIPFVDYPVLVDHIYPEEKVWF